MSEETNRTRSDVLTEDRLGTRARVFGTESAILVGILYGDPDEEESLRELESLADTAGITVLAVMNQKRSRPHPATFIGKGKVDELQAVCSELEADVVVFNEELSPAQARNLETALKVKVIDRTQLIMDIFAQRAGTKEAKLQVELAQLHYLLPRLRGWGAALTRAGGRAVGGVGTRGPGETQLELDRNKIYRRIHSLERRLKKTAGERAVRRQKRERSAVPVIALVGYTNSGKSTLLNKLCDSDAFVEDKLFATLDTRVRRTDIVPGRAVLIVDTVGFIRDLPHDLVPAFAATLEAAHAADLLLHLVDASKPSRESDLHAVQETLESEVFHGVVERPHILTVWNKIDHCASDVLEHLEGTAISALDGTGVDALRGMLVQMLFPENVERRFTLPHQALYALHPLTAAGRAEIVSYSQNGAQVKAVLSAQEWRDLEAIGARLNVAASAQDGAQ